MPTSSETTSRTSSTSEASPQSLPDTLSALDGLTDERAESPDPSPLIVADGELNAAVLSWMIGRPDGIQPDRPASQRVGMRDVRAIQTAAGMFMKLDFLYGGGHGHKALCHYFRHEVLPLLSASYSERVGKSLYGAAAEIAQLHGPRTTAETTVSPIAT